MKHLIKAPDWFPFKSLSDMERASLYWIFKVWELKQKAWLQRDSVAKCYIIFINSLKSIMITFKGQKKDLFQL